YKSSGKWNMIQFGSRRFRKHRGSLAEEETPMMRTKFRWQGIVVYAATLAAFLTIVGASSPNALAGPLPANWTCTGTCGTDGQDGVIDLSPLGTSQYEYISTYGTDPAGLGVATLPGLSPTFETNGSVLDTPIFAATAGATLNYYFDYVT